MLRSERRPGARKWKAVWLKPKNGKHRLLVKGPHDIQAEFIGYSEAKVMAAAKRKAREYRKNISRGYQWHGYM
jgi:hypothetical protein